MVAFLAGLGVLALGFAAGTGIAIKKIIDSAKNAEPLVIPIINKQYKVELITK